MLHRGAEEGRHMMRGLEDRITSYSGSDRHKQTKKFLSGNHKGYDQTMAADNVADAMREYYDQHRPRRWWQRKQSYPEGLADDLMLGLMRVAIDESRIQGILPRNAIEAQRAETGTGSVHESAVHAPKEAPNDR